MSAEARIAVDAELLQLVRAEFASASGHTFHRSAVLSDLTKHDHRLVNDECLSCALLELLDDALHEAPEVRKTA